MKSIGVQQGLDDIKNRLEQEGYKVTDINDPNAYFSAMIYSSDLDNYSDKYINNVESIFMSGMGTAEGYSLMLNAAEMSLEEIVSRIKILKD